MGGFQSYIVRKNVGDTAFNFAIADAVAAQWYDTPRSRSLSEDELMTLPFIARRSGDIGWREMEILREKIALPGSHIVECGCHHGFMTIALAAWIGEAGFIDAFDALASNARIASDNLALNGIDNAAVHCAAIGGECGLVQLYDESNVIATKTDRHHKRSAIMIRPSLLFQTPPDGLKLDIEGHELAVIESDSEWIAKIPRLAIEVHSDLIGGSASVNRLIRALGARPLYILRSDNNLSEYAGEAISESVHLFSW